MVVIVVPPGGWGALSDTHSESITGCKVDTVLGVDCGNQLKESDLGTIAYRILNPRS